MLFKPDDNTAADAGGASRDSLGRRLRRSIVSSLIALIIVGGLGYIVWTTFKPPVRTGARQDLPVPVLATTAQRKDVPVYLDGVGSVRALNTVTVRAQVDGKLMAVKFTEGQDVTQGDVLAEIDPAIYQAQFDQAVAKKSQDEATLANAKIDLQRYQQLAQTNAGPKQQADTQRALVAQLEAQIRADQAAIDNAQTTLSYTKVTAPITGRTGLRQVDAGNIVHASDTTGIVVIAQLKPIALQFSLPQQQINQVNSASAKGPLTVDVFGNDGRTVVDTGSLVSIDNQVDPTTGTVKLKGQFPNDTLQLWPGQFANVRLKVNTLRNAVVVPTSAVQRGPSGTYVYMIGDDNIATAHPVTVTQQNDVEAVIGTGLSASERVVTTGFANLADGARVIVGRDDSAPAPDIAPRRKGGGAGKGPGQGQGQGQGQGPGQGGQGRQDQGQGQNGGGQSGPGSGAGQQGPRPPNGTPK